MSCSKLLYSARVGTSLAKTSVMKDFKSCTEISAMTASVFLEWTYPKPIYPLHMRVHTEYEAGGSAKDMANMSYTCRFLLKNFLRRLPAILLNLCPDLRPPLCIPRHVPVPVPSQAGIG